MRTRRILSGGLLATFILAGAAVPASAQTKLPVTFDVVGGINIATLNLPLPEFQFEEFDVDVSIGNRIGFVGGVLIGVPASEVITFETGGLISYKGASMDVTVTIPELGTVSADADISILYLDVPALGRFRVVRSSSTTVRALAGVTLGIKMSAEGTVSAMGTSESQPLDGVSSFDLGLTFGGRVDIGKFLVDGRYTFGMLNLADDDAPSGEAVKNRTLSIMGGWRF
jgi:hypothetical protein